VLFRYRLTNSGSVGTASQRNFKYYSGLQSAEILLEKKTQTLEVKARTLSSILKYKSGGRCNASQGMANSIKDQIGNILGFGGHMVSVATAQYNHR